MSTEEALEQLKALEGSRDAEMAHCRADEVLLDFLATNGFQEVSEAWVNVNEKVGFWYS